MIDAKLVGRVRGTNADDLQPGDVEAAASVNGRRDLMVAQSLPPKAEIVRLGNSYMCSIATGSAFTYVAAWPTTRGELVLYNGETGPQAKSYIIDSAWMVNLTSSNVSQPIALLAQIVPAATAPTDDTAQLIVSLSGKPNYGGKAKRAVANTSMGQVASKWDLLASAVPAVVTNLGLGVRSGDLYGEYIVPPGAGFALAGVAGTAAGTAILGVKFHEAWLALG